MHERFLRRLLYDTPIFAQTRICKLFENKVYNLDIIMRLYACALTSKMRAIYLKASYVHNKMGS